MNFLTSDENDTMESDEILNIRIVRQFIWSRKEQNK